MSDAQREMTLDEWMDALPDGHGARKEFDELRSRLAAAEAERDSWRRVAELAALREAAVLPCGHPISLLLHSAETGEPLYCELCDDKGGRRDAERCETELRAELAALREAAGKVTCWRCENARRILMRGQWKDCPDCAPLRTLLAGETECARGAVSVVNPQGTEETGNDRPAAPIPSCGGWRCKTPEAGVINPLRCRWCGWLLADHELVASAADGKATADQPDAAT